MTVMDGLLEVRKMDAAIRYELISLLDINEGWKQLMSVITVDCSPYSDLKYTIDHINRIEIAGHTQRRSCSEIFLEEWGTSGRRRPNLMTLAEFLVKAKLLRAAEYVTSKILNGQLPDRPKEGPSASIDVSIIDQLTCSYNSEDFRSTFYVNLSCSDINTIKNNKRFSDIEVPYKYLYDNTNGFSNSCLIGNGGFGKVYKGSINNCEVAIKRMNKVFDKKDFDQYLKEIEIVIKCKHENLLPLLAISYDVEPCVIYEFMEHGSLLDCLSLKDEVSIIDWMLRLNVASDIANGLVYLHTNFENPIIHRDIKTANILLNSKFIAKIGDFGLTRVGDHTMTSVVFGTSAYMSPEAFRGDISVKMDVFSFGIVLLELLTGLPPYDKSRIGCDLLTHIYEIERPINELLDKRAGCWNLNIGIKMYELAILCTTNKSQRPFMHGQEGVLELLKNIHSTCDHLKINNY